VQSCIKPDWSSLHENFTLEVSCKTVHEQYTNIQSGMRLIFRLQANPTKRIGKSDNKADARFKDAKKRRRVELRTDEERIRWLKRKGEENGFRLAKVRVAPVENAAVIAQSRIKAWRKNDQKTMTFASVLFEGVLEVTDAEALRNALIRGIGPGKAYGFGLLSVAPIPD
jgi:CRISPR system Cascade subunit CasE